MTALADFCIYTIVHRDYLTEAARKGGPAHFVESKAWVTGRKLWHEAQAAGIASPVLLGDATDCREIKYWGLLTVVEIEGDTTRFTVDRVRPFPRKYTPQELILRSSGETIAPNFIRPYAICRTPDFLREA